MKNLIWKFQEVISVCLKVSPTFRENHTASDVKFLSEESSFGMEVSPLFPI